MKRKLLSVLLTFCLAFSLLPTAALAEEPADPVAQIGEKTYATLKAAFEEAKDGDTVTLLKDVETNNIEDTVEARIIINKAITLNLNDKTIKSPDNMGNNNTNFTALIVDADVIINATTGGINTGKNGGYGINVRNGATLTINGGTYYGGGTAVQVQKGTLIINDGTFACEPYSNPTYGYKFLINCIDAAWKDGTAKISIKGGTFVKFDPSDSASENPHGKFLAEGYGVKQVGDNYIVTEPVAAIGDTKYPTLAAAISAAGNGDTVTLLENAESAETLQIGKSITLDLGDYKFERTGSGNEARAIYINDGADVTIKANEAGGVKAATIALQVKAGGKLTIQGGTYDAAYALASFSSATKAAYTTIVDGVFNGWVYTNGTGHDDHITINGGTYNDMLYLASGDRSTYVINDGTFNTSLEIDAGKLDIMGGTFKASVDTTNNVNKPATNNNGSGAYVGIIVVCKPDGTSASGYIGDAVVNIKGGTFENTFANGETIVVADFGNEGDDIGDAKVIISDDAKIKGKIALYTSENNIGASFTVTGGLFTSDPSSYKAADRYVVASDVDGYTYMVTATAPTDDQKITVVDKTNASVDPSITGNDKTAIDSAMNSGKTNVDGVAEAVSTTVKTGIVNDAKDKANNVPDGEVTSTEIEVKVNVSVTEANLSEGSMTFKAEPVANVKVNGIKLQDSENKPVEVPVSNAMLNGKPITVKLPLPTVNGSRFTPKQILHKFTGGGYEYFINKDEGSKLGAGSFKIEDNCAVFTIYGFSTFELSGTVTYVEPSYSSGSSSYDPTYSVSTPSKTEHGTVTVSPKSASKGDRVTVTVKPDSGYVLETLTVTDKNGNELTLKDKGNGKYTFTMPAGKVEVKATFMEDNSMLNFFYDVPNDAYFYEAVKWAVKNGITTGVGNDLFAPEQPCTRAQIVTFLWRAAGSPEPKGAASGMTDVVSGSYYEKAVAWAIENGITTGTTTSTFSPDATCTRAQAVTFLARALKAKAASAAEFSDVPTGSYFADAVAWAAANGVTEGIGGGLFGSDNDCTRGQIVTFLYRAYNK